MHQGFQPARRAALVTLAGVLAACGGGGSSGSDDPPAEPVGQVINSSIKSASTGSTYAIQVYLPPGYAGGTAQLPVIYATEGDAPYGAATPGTGGSSRSRFDTFKESMQRRGTAAILVGIGGTAWRNTDFLQPGASKYLDFIVKELAPAVESQYRADPKRRALSGLSHGGYFVIAALVLEAQAGRSPSFSHYLSTEVSVGEHSGPAGLLAFEKTTMASPCQPPFSSLAHRTETIRCSESRCTTRWPRKPFPVWSSSKPNTAHRMWVPTYPHLKRR